MKIRSPVGMTLALLLSMSAFFIPVVSAATYVDAVPPELNAWLNDETLHIEASDAHSGVEAVYVAGRRVNYRVNQTLDLDFLDYADGKEYVSIHAADFAGNKSVAVHIRNPFYSKPQSTATAPQSTQSSTPRVIETTPKPTSKPKSVPVSSRKQTLAYAQEEVEPPETPQPQIMATPSPQPSHNPLTPDGSAAVLDNATEDQGKEFFTVKTPSDSIFYLIVDRQRDGENVYFLNDVTEDDLSALAKKGEKTETVIPTPAPTATPEPDPTPTPQPEEAPKKSGGASIVLVLLAVAAVGGAGYYFKILKPRQNAATSADDMDTYEDDDENDLDEDYPDEDIDYGEAVYDDDEPI